MGDTGTAALIAGFPALRSGISRRLGSGAFILACVLWVAAFPQSARAEAEAETLEQLRQRHQEARATFAKTKDYGKAYKESREAAHKLISALLDHWRTLPDGVAGVPVVCREIRIVYKEMAGSPLTERHNIEKSFLARTVWPLLADDDLRPDQAVFLLELTKPQMGVRMNDRKARRGEPTEPLGWDVQGAHALALIRSGNDKKARDEITNLHGKVSINRAHNPRGSLDYGPEAGDGRYRDYTDYLQLCEALHALQAAIAHDREGARKHIAKARKLREALSPEATPLVAEAARRVKMDKD
ncbi:MAG: hypothetical protein HKN82_11780 [Akkermansiaceae bacterium]|nr:hypothetical protein [Akkermansiaceae bacterium]